MDRSFSVAKYLQPATWTRKRLFPMTNIDGEDSPTQRHALYPEPRTIERDISCNREQQRTEGTILVHPFDDDDTAEC